MSATTVQNPQICVIYSTRLLHSMKLTAEPTSTLLLQAAEGVHSFCKTILMLRALLQHQPLAPVLEVLLNHINFEEFVLAGKKEYCCSLCVCTGCKVY